MNTTYSKHDEKDVSVELKLRALYELQTVVSEVDKIKVLRGELPLEVQDLEDEIAGLKTRLINLDSEIKNLETATNNKRIIANCNSDWIPFFIICFIVEII